MNNEPDMISKQNDYSDSPFLKGKGRAKSNQRGIPSGTYGQTFLTDNFVVGNSAAQSCLNRKRDISQISSILERPKT